jgi:hypothetical protein
MWWLVYCPAHSWGTYCTLEDFWLLSWSAGLCGSYPTLVHVWKNQVQGTLNFNKRGKTPDALRAMLRVILEVLRGMEALVWCKDNKNP